MLHLYQSNKVERLFAQLVTLLVQPLENPLEQDIVVVENPGLAHWLKVQLANALGIAANIEFPMPSRFFWQIQRQMMADTALETVFNKDGLSWLILECLQDEQLLSRPEYQVLNHYLNDGHSGAQLAIRQYKLASTIADLYDQYLVYRPDWIANWELHELQIDGQPLADNQWQGLLWNELLGRVASKHLPVQHRAHMLADFLAYLKQGNLTALPKRVVFFGFTTLPKHQLDSLAVLAEHMDIHLMTPNPCQYYWGDVLDESRQARLRMRGQTVLAADAGNDLLASLGQMGQDYQRLLIDTDAIEEHSLFYESQQDSLLACIQNQILNLQQPSLVTEASQPYVIQADDQSLQIVGCHSPMREIEVLHDHLLDVFSKGEIKPQEIVVMIPDVASYAPYIDAVFTAQAPTSGGIPYSISDRPLQAEHPMLTAFLGLLALPHSRLGLSEVMALLEMPAIYRMYGLQEHQLPALLEWLQQAGVRWGLNAQHREQQGLPAWQQNTWLYGFKRLLMGYAMQGRQGFAGISAIESVEGLETAQLGGLMKFVQDIEDFVSVSQAPKDSEQWSVFLRTALDTFFKVEADEQPILEHIFLAIEKWLHSIQTVKYHAVIEFSVLADGLNQALQRGSGSQHFMVGKVNFCTLLPMRSIPFKLVAVLGLNDQDYPRSVTPSSLDLMRFKRRLGDRSRRDEDRYLFLEAILSARQSLWLSYRSRSQNNDDPLTPSVVLAELLDYLERGFVLANGEKNVLCQLFQQHPLQGFNPRYYQESDGLYSYNALWYGVHKPVAQANELSSNAALLNASPAPVTVLEDVLLENLLQFYQHPCQYYLKTVLSVNLNFTPEGLDDDEPFSMDGLTQFAIKQDFLRQVTSAESMQVISEQLTEGHLAFGEIGQQQQHYLQQAMAPLQSLCQTYMQQQNTQPTEINLVFNDLSCRLLGWQGQRFNQRLVKAHGAKLKAKYLIAFLIEHAALCAMNNGHESILICQDRWLSVQAIGAQSAHEYLQILLSHYQQGLLAPLAFLPETAWQFYNPANVNSKSDNREKAAHNTFFGSDNLFAAAAEKDDIHVRRCLGELTEIPTDLSQQASDVFAIWFEQSLLEITPI